MRFKIIFVSFFILVSCTNSTDRTANEHLNCTITIDQLLDKYSQRVFGTNVVKGNIIEFRDKGEDSVVAGYYSFYNNKHLKSYRFFSDIQTYLYNEEYDSTGVLTKAEGNPLVLRIVKRVNIDSIWITQYFFSMNKTYKDLTVSTMTDKNFSVKLKDDTLYSNMKSGSFGINFKGYSKIKAYLSIEYFDSCMNRGAIIKDTINLGINTKHG